MKSYTWVKDMRDGGAVTRYHTRRMLRPQTNDAHSWGVAVLLLAVGASAPVVAAALVHDCHEYCDGDTPANAKWGNPALSQVLDDMASEFNQQHGIDMRALSPSDMLLLRWADVFELVQHAMTDAHMGNRYAIEIIHNGIGALQRLQPRMAKELGGVYVDVNEMTQQLFNEAQVYL
jgi:hypothetical protein